MPHYSYVSKTTPRVYGLVGRKRLTGKTALAAFNKKTIKVRQ